MRSLVKHEGAAQLANVVSNAREWRRGIALIAMIAVLLTACTAWYALQAEEMSGRTRWLLGFLTLRRENNLASWYAAMLLLAAAFLFFDSRNSLHGTNVRVGRSFLLLSILLTGLSLDEGGSLHERVELLPNGEAMLLAPAAIVFLVLLAYSLKGLYERPEYRMTAMRVVCAFALFATVPFQEKLGHDLVQTPVGEAVFGSLEEATELAGSLLLLWAAIVSSLRARGRSDLAGLNESASRARRTVLIVSVAAVPLLAYVSAVVTDDFRGHPADWYMASLFAFAAIADRANGRSVPSWQRMLRFALYATASASMVFPPGADLASGLELSRRAVLITLSIVALAGQQLVTGTHAHSRTALLAVGAFGFLAWYEASSDSTLMQYALAQGIALYTCLLSSRAGSFGKDSDSNG